jgi:hypothetical protein
MAAGDSPRDTVSSWWSNDGQHEIDIVGTPARRPTFIGSVRWRPEPSGEVVLNELERDAAALDAPNIPRLLVGRGGLRPDVASRGCSRRLRPTIFIGKHVLRMSNGRLF